VPGRRGSSAQRGDPSASPAVCKLVSVLARKLVLRGDPALELTTASVLAFGSEEWCDGTTGLLARGPRSSAGPISGVLPSCTTQTFSVTLGALRLPSAGSLWGSSMLASPSLTGALLADTVRHTLIVLALVAVGLEAPDLADAVRLIVARSPFHTDPDCAPRPPTVTGRPFAASGGFVVPRVR
jgi:hypothetical protein